MTDKDRQLIAKIDLMKVRGMIERIEELEELNERLRSRCEIGSMDYSKDRVQATPKNTLEENLVKVVDNIHDTRNLKKYIEEAKEKVLKIDSEEDINVLLLIYFENKSYLEVTRLRGYKHRSNVEYIHKRALLKYFYTTYRKDIDFVH